MQNIVIELLEGRLETRHVKGLYLKPIRTTRAKILGISEQKKTKPSTFFSTRTFEM